jgi:formylglycine-generating enzyme required for sulfatase activity
VLCFHEVLKFLIEETRRNSVTGIKNHWTTKLIIFFLALGLLSGGQSILPRETGLEGLFQWAVKKYLDEKYWEVSKDLDLLLSFFDENHNQLKGKIYLLLGAAWEQLGEIEKAKKNYQLALELLEKPMVEGIDLTSLPEYQRMIMNKQKPFDQEKIDRPITRRIIEKPITRPKRKKRISPLYMIAGGAILVAVTVAFVLKKKVQEEEIEFIPDYDTRVLEIDWIRIPPGAFNMGDNFNEGEEDEQPVHAAYMDEYFISKYEVTFRQFDKYCIETGFRRPYDHDWGRRDRPVINLTWAEAVQFCQWLSRKTRKNIHLPSEAQWEKAARGVDQRRYPWGNSPPDCSKANCNNCYNQTQPVGSYPAGVSPYDVHDMAGNVSEMCLDQYNVTFYSNSPSQNPLNNPGSDNQYTIYVIRGGSWSGNDGVGYRAADRGSISPENMSNTVGFRLVMER